MLVFLFQTLLQVFAGGTHPTGYVDESQHFLIQILITEKRYRKEPWRGKK